MKSWQKFFMFGFLLLIKCRNLTQVCDILAMQINNILSSKLNISSHKISKNRNTAYYSFKGADNEDTVEISDKADSDKKKSLKKKIIAGLAVVGAVIVTILLIKRAKKSSDVVDNAKNGVNEVVSDTKPKNTSPDKKPTKKEEPKPHQNDDVQNPKEEQTEEPKKQEEPKKEDVDTDGEPQG